MNKVLSIAHSTVFHRSISAMFSSNKISKQKNLSILSDPTLLMHNLNSSIPYRPNTAHALHSFCIQAREAISAMLSIATTLYIAATHNITHSPCTSTCTTHHHIVFHNSPLHTTNKHKAYLCKWRQNGTRCRDGV